MAFANDTDFGFLAGMEAIQILSFKLQGRTRETKKLVSMTIMSPSSSTFYDIVDKIQVPRSIVKEASYNMLEIILQDHYRVRVLCAVAFEA